MDYTDPQTVAAYLEMHFQADPPLEPELAGHYPEGNFFDAILELIPRQSREKGGKALDLGCAVGGLALRLSRDYQEVAGVDLSEALIASADLIRLGGVLEFPLKVTGKKQRMTRFQRPEDCEPESVTFTQEDASLYLKRVDGESQDLVALLNLLCRVPDARGLLSAAASKVAPQGLLIIASPHSWDPIFSPVANWLAPTKDGLEFSHETLMQHLEGFTLLEKRVQPFSLRIHERLRYVSLPDVLILQKT